MKNEIDVVHLPPEDWKSFKQFRLKALKTDPQAFGKSYEAEIAEPDEKWKTRLADSGKGKSWSLFAKKNNKIVGMIGAALIPDKKDEAGIYGVFVDEKHRGKGVAKKLMTHVIEELTRSGKVKKIELAVNKKQLAAVNLYKKFGFRIFNEKDQMMGNGEKVREFEMEKIL